MSTPIHQNERLQFSASEQPKENRLQTLLAELMLARRNKDEKTVSKIQQDIQRLREDPDIVAGTVRQTDQVKNSDQ